MALSPSSRVLPSFLLLLLLLPIFLTLMDVAHADVYLHHPRGSNNRLNERSANRNNGNRMFDSQNNNRGGYNKGDVDTSAAGANIHKQYDMKHFMGDRPTTIPLTTGGEKFAIHGAHAHSSDISKRTGKSHLTIEWTNQHGCGGNEHSDPHKTNCNLNIQYMCARQFQRSRARLDCEGRCFIKDVDYYNSVINRELDYDCSVETKPALSPCAKFRSANAESTCLDKCAGKGLNDQGRLGMCEYRLEAYDTLKQQLDNTAGGSAIVDDSLRRSHEFIFWHDTPDKELINNQCVYDNAEITTIETMLKGSDHFDIDPTKGETLERFQISCKTGFQPSCSGNGIVCCPAGQTTGTNCVEPPSVGRTDSRRGAFFKVKVVAKWITKPHYKHNCPHASCSDTSSVPCGSFHETETTESRGGDGPAGGISYRFRDGTTTNRQDFTNPSNTEDEEKRLARWITTNANEKQNRGLHESWEWYDECYRRERNRGLFTADQNLRNNNLGYSSAVYTRQNPNNNRRGYECPEERDYWPYWHPSPWRDIAVLTDRIDLCPHFKAESQNVKSKFWCRNTANNARALRFNNERQCIQQKGIWEEVSSHGLPPPDCQQAPWSRVNHLGNGRFGQANTYNWSIPYDVLADVYEVNLADNVMNANEQNLKCVVRLRYNMTTDDYDGWKTDSNFNQKKNQGIKSPVQQNPEVNLGASMQALRLAINTAQFGRTFQDRSHVFQLVPRTEHQSAPELNLAGVDIHNLNVRGKRCNIVQCYPSVEYDFVPNHLHIKEGDVVHFQWTGSNTHNNGNPAGDGQAGDAGEGTGGTDRHNVVEMVRDWKNSSFPATWEENTLFKGALWAAPIVDRVAGQKEDGTALTGTEAELGTGVRRSTGRVDWEKSCGMDPTTGEVMSAYKKTGVTSGCGRPWKHDMAMAHGSAHFYKQFPVKQERNANVQTLDDVRAPSKTGQLNNLLNNADASVNLYLFKPRQGHYDFMCTRNNNFSNRDQKGSLVVGRKDE